MEAMPSPAVWLRKCSHLAFTLLLGLSLSLVLFAGWKTLSLVNQPFPGFAYLDLGQGHLFINALNQRHWSGFQQGLQLTDVIIAVEGQALEKPNQLKALVAKTPINHPLTYTVLRHGERLEIQIPVTTFSWMDYWLVGGLCFFTALALISMAALVYFLRSNSQGTWAIVLFSLALAIYTMNGVEASLNHQTTFFFWLAGCCIPATVAQLTAQFPRKNLFCAAHAWLIPLIYLASLGLALLPFSPWAPAYPEFVGHMLFLSLLSAGAAGTFFFYSMARLYRSKELLQSQATLVKLRVKLLLFGAVAAFGLPGCLAILTVILPYYLIPFNYLALFLLIFPMTASFAIIQYNLFNVDSYLKKTLASFFVFDATLALYFLFYLLLEKTGFSHFRQSPVFTLGFTLLILVLFTPLYALILGWMERLFNRGRLNFYQAASKLNQKLAMVLTRQEIIDLLARLLLDDLGVSKVTIWQNSHPEVFSYTPDGKNVCSMEVGRLFETQLGLIQNLQAPLFISEVHENQRLQPEMRQCCLTIFEKLEAVLLLPLTFQQALIGLLVLSGKAHADPYTTEELSVLETLGYQSAIALENASFYETIRDLNENLEHKVEERTRALTEAIAEKEKTQQQLVQSESLAAIGQLVAGVAHELNNPLGSAHSLVQSAIEILEEQGPQTSDEEEIIDDLKFVLKEQNRAREIVQSLLDLSRQTTSYAEPVNLNLVIEDAIRIMFNKYKYLEVTLEKKLAPDLPTLQGNFAQLGQVCINIIQNAIQAVAPQRGVVTLETGQEEDYLYFRCSDNGGGISEEKRKDIFKPFFTTKTVGEGTGLGLYICHEIIDRHQGEILVSQSASTGGAVFEIRLPLKPSATKKTDLREEGARIK